MVVLGLAAGAVTGLMGIGGGVILVPAMVYLLSMARHLAQGRSVFFALSHFQQPIRELLQMRLDSELPML
jgi:uncharacterized membrane protein YfcA